MKLTNNEVEKVVEKNIFTDMKHIEHIFDSYENEMKRYFTKE